MYIWIGIGITLIILLLLIVLLIRIYIKYIEVRNKLYENDAIYLGNRGKISLLEAQCKSYKEGQNPFTTLRNITSIIRDEE